MIWPIKILQSRRFERSLFTLRDPAPLKRMNGDRAPSGRSLCILFLALSFDDFDTCVDVV